MPTLQTLEMFIIRHRGIQKQRFHEGKGHARSSKCRLSRGKYAIHGTGDGQGNHKGRDQEVWEEQFGYSFCDAHVKDGISHEDYREVNSDHRSHH